VNQTGLAAATAEHSAAAHAVLLGRNTFVSFRGLWPNQVDDHTGVTEDLNQVHKYVVSPTLDDPGWELHHPSRAAGGGRPSAEESAWKGHRRHG
jgi:dihydrofolate reductase